MGEAVSPNPIDVAVGARIRVRRKELGMSQAALAEQLGVSFQQVQKYERGANRISASMLVKTARALDCPGGFLLGARTVKEENHAPQEDALQAELNSLLAIPGAVELLRAFAKVPQGEARSSVLAIVRSLANRAGPCRGA